jgi:hypothetical protein
MNCGLLKFPATRITNQIPGENNLSATTTPFGKKHREQTLLKR